MTVIALDHTFAEMLIFQTILFVYSCLIFAFEDTENTRLQDPVNVSFVDTRQVSQC